MTTKEYLKQVEILDSKIKQKRMQADELREMALSVGAIDYSRDRVQTSPHCDLNNLVIKYITIENEINKKIEDYMNLKDKIIGEIHSLSKKEHIVFLHKRYIEFKSLELIAVEMHYNYSYIRHLHKSALNDFEESTQKHIAMC